jgi:hypothetical protein
LLKLCLKLISFCCNIWITKGVNYINFVVNSFSYCKEGEIWHNILIMLICLAT